MLDLLETDLRIYEKHRKRAGGDTGHILEHPPAPNRLLIGDEDWAAKALAEITEMKLQNFAAELQALEQRKRKKDLQNRLVEGPHNPWRPTRHGPMREVILTANKEWFNADPDPQFRQIHSAFCRWYRDGSTPRD